MTGWIPARAGDAAAIHELRRKFCEEEGILFEPEIQQAALTRLLEDASLGAVFIFAQAGGGAGGFLILTRCFSLEFGGVYALLDELYLEPDSRGQGVGQTGIDVATSWAKQNAIHALRLEVSHRNSGARKLYERRGFTADGRDMLTLRL